MPAAEVFSAAVLLLLKKIKARREGRNQEFKHELLDFKLVRRDSDWSGT